MFTLLIIQLAQITNPAIKDGPLKTGPGGIAYLVSRGYTLVLSLAGLAFFIFFLYGGIRWLISGGDKAALEGARQTLINAGLGLIIVVGAFAITKVVEATLGLNIFNA